MNTNTNRIYAPIIFAITLFITLFILKPGYMRYMDSLTAENTAKNLQEKRQTELNNLSALRTSFSASGTTEITEKVKKLDKKWNESQILSAIMLTDFTRQTEFVSAPIEISSIRIDRGNKLPSGLSLGNIELVLIGKSVDNIIDFLTYLTSNSTYVFTLDAISLPISAPVQKDDNGVSLSVNLGVYYYE